MRKSIKSLLSLTLTLAIVFSFGFVFADDKGVDKEKIGNQLVELGLVCEGENGLEADKLLSREDAMVVLAKLMNKDEEAKNYKGKIQFKDVKDDYYKPYIAYAADQKWTYGKSKNSFGFGDTITVHEFSTILLRTVKQEAKTFCEVPKLAEELGLLEDLNAKAKDKITRGDAFVMVRNALKIKVNGAENDKNLYEKLYFEKFKNDTDKIVLVHTNDMHGFFVEHKYHGMGAAKVKRFVNLVKAANKDAVYVDAGDAIQGSNLVTLSKGDAAIDVLEGLEVEFMVLGNHEFDYTQEKLDTLIEKASFPMLACNILDKDGNRVYKPYCIKEVKGKKIAFVGFGTPETTFKSHPKNTEGLTFEDPVVAGKKVVKELEGKADILVGICHLGIEKLEEDWTSTRLAENVPEFKVLIDGHSHTKLENGSLVNGVMIAQAGEHTKNVGYVTIDLNDMEKPATAMLFTKNQAKFIQNNEKVLGIVNGIKEENKKILGEEIRETPVKLIGERLVVRKGESNLGNLLTASLIDISGADIALMNGGGIRETIEVGMVTKGHILSVFPFGNTVKVVKITGADVKAVLENGFSVYPEANGGFPHIAGLKVKFDAKKEPGSRLVEVLDKNGNPIEDDKFYTLVTNDFLVAGGDGYKMLKGKPVVGEYGALDEILIDYIIKNGFEDAKMTNWLEIINK